jgi:hypothetical protein
MILISKRAQDEVLNIKKMAGKTGRLLELFFIITTSSILFKKEPKTK